MYTPLSQFDIYMIVSLRVLNYFIVYLNNLNVVVFSLIVFFFMTIYLLMDELKIIPNKIQYVLENLFLFVYLLVYQQVGNKGLKFFPILFTIFMTIILLNIIGLLPLGFAVTSHFVWSLYLSLSMGLGIFFVVSLYLIYIESIRLLWYFYLWKRINYINYLFRKKNKNLRLNKRNKFVKVKEKVKVFKRSYHKKNLLLNPPKVEKPTQVNSNQSISTQNNKITINKHDKYKGDGEEPPYNRNELNKNVGHYDESNNQGSQLNNSWEWVKNTIIESKNKLFKNYVCSYIFKDKIKNKDQTYIAFNKVVLNDVRTEEEINLTLYHDIINLTASNKIKIFKGILNGVEEVEDLEDFKDVKDVEHLEDLINLINLIKDLYWDSDLNLIVNKLYLLELINRYNHGSIILISDSEEVGFEIVSTTLNVERRIQLRTTENVEGELVEIVQQLFFNSDGTEIGAFYTKKINLNQNGVDLQAFTVTKISDTVKERIIIEHLTENGAYLHPYFLNANELAKLNFSHFKLLKKMKRRSEEDLRIALQEIDDFNGILENNQNSRELLVEFIVSRLLNGVGLSNTINYPVRGVFGTGEFNDICTEIINDEEQILMHIGYYIELFDRNPELMDKYFYKSENGEIFVDECIKLFNKLNINEGLYEVIKEIGIHRLRSEFTIEEIYELIKEKC